MQIYSETLLVILLRTEKIKSNQLVLIEEETGGDLLSDTSMEKMKLKWLVL